MSAINAVARLDNIQQMIHLAEPDFNKLAQIHGAVTFAAEASFAHEILKNSDFLTKVAVGNPDSFKRAILNVATIGLSLSPVFKLAYLVPRDGKICLDISYQGYLKLAYDAGGIKFAAAEIVYASDEFEVRSFAEEPKHIRKPFDPNRGAIVGAYCVARTHADQYITTTMNTDELGGIRDRSESWKAYQNKGVKTPWITDETEMIKKTVIRRAYKMWPKSDTRMRLDEAIEVGSQSDPTDLSSPLAAVTTPAQTLDVSPRSKALTKMREMLQILDETEFSFAQHSTRVCKREIKKIDDMTDPEIKAANAMLSQMIDKKNAEVKS